MFTFPDSVQLLLLIINEVTIDERLEKKNKPVSDWTRRRKREKKVRVMRQMNMPCEVFLKRSPI